MKKTILVRGTGTIGYKLLQHLIRLDSLRHPSLTWDKIIFEKQTPNLEDLPRIQKLRNTVRGGTIPTLAVPSDRFNDFKNRGFDPEYTTERAIALSDIIMDITPYGYKNKVAVYETLKQGKIFIAQGSESKRDVSFGNIFIGGINEKAIIKNFSQGQKYFVIGSCNAHAIARNVAMIINEFNEFDHKDIQIDLVILRRSDDLNKKQVAISFSPSTQDPKYNYEGTYHIYNVNEAYKTIGIEHLDLRSRAGKLTDPYMHAVYWRIDFPTTVPNAEKRLLKAAKEEMYCAVTGYMEVNRVHYEIREIQEFDLKGRRISPGRCYNHSVLVMPTVSTHERRGRTVLDFATFTPQDSNVILSNLELAWMARDIENFDLEEYEKFVKSLLMKDI